MEIYVVRSGDTAEKIAERYGIPLSMLISDNSLSASGELAVGQALLILQPRVIHTIEQGESLFSVAEMYGTSIMQLYRNNPTLIGVEYIPVGTQITISFTDRPSSEAEISGFAYGYIKRDVLRAALPYLTYLIVFGYGFNDDGSIISVDDTEIISIAHEYQTAVLLSLTSINQDGTFSSEKIEKILTDIELQNKVIANLIEIIIQKNAQGLDIDMEYISPDYRDRFTAFVENFAAQLNASGLKLHVDLAPKSSSEQMGTLYEAHDYASLGAAANMVFLMTYEWGYT